MTTASFSTVIGVFSSLDQAERAIDALRHARFSYDRIRLVERGSGGFFDALKGMFTGQAAVASNTADSLIKMGMPDYEAQHYQHELDAHHVLVLMNADERPEEAFTVMRQCGAFDLNARFRGDSSNASAEVNNRQRVQETPRSEIAPTAPSSNAPSSMPRPDVSAPAPDTDTAQAPVSDR